MAQGFKKGTKFIPTGRSSSSAIHASDIIGSPKSKGKKLNLEFQFNCPRCGRRRAGSFSKRGNICHCNN